MTWRRVWSVYVYVLAAAYGWHLGEGQYVLAAADGACIACAYWRSLA